MTLGTGGRCPQAQAVLQGPWCFAVAGVPFGSIGGWKRAYIFYSLVFLSVQKATLGTAGPAVKSRKPAAGLSTATTFAAHAAAMTLGTGGRCPQAQAVLQGLGVLL